MSHPLFLVALLLQLPPKGGAYHNEAYGFQLMVPPQWVQVPDSIFRARIELIRQNGASESQTNYVAAFARAPERGWFAYPYVLIQVEPFDPDDTVPPSLDSVAAQLNAMVPEPTGNRLITQPPSAVTARYDRDKGAVLLRAGRSQLRGGAWVMGYSGIKLTRRGLVSANAYGMESDSLATEAIRDFFLAGLKADTPPHGP